MKKKQKKKKLGADKKLDSAIAVLCVAVVPQMNRKSEQAKAGTYEFIRHQDILDYFMNFKQGIKPTEAGRIAAEKFWFHHASKRYRPNNIRTWANQYLELGFLPKSGKGKHIEESSASPYSNVEE